MRILYSLVLYLSAPLVLLKLLLRGRKNPDYLRRLPERFGFITKPASRLPVIWIHAASVGEVGVAAALLARLLEVAPRCQTLITTTTPTGAGQVSRLFEGGVVHRYLPYDLPYAVRLFLRRAEPRLLILLETEIWPNLLHYCQRRGVPVALVNARLSAASYRGYRRFGRFTAQTLGLLSHIITRSDTDARRFLDLGAPPGKVSVAGNLKFDVAVPRDIAGQSAALRRSLAGERPVWIAASIHQGEEKPVLDAFQRVRETLRDCLLIIAPRHPERFDKVYNLCRRRGFCVVRRTGPRDPAREHRNTDIYLVDTLGELPVFYGCADAAFIGGSLAPAGGHNVLEAARMGIPVITGKYVHNFREIISLFEAGDAITIVSEPAELADRLVDLLADADLRRAYGERGQGIVARNQGAMDAVMAQLGDFMKALR